MSTWTSEARLERARLAIVDPLGELEAIAPLSWSAAVAIIHRLSAHLRTEHQARARIVRDDRDLLTALGVPNTTGRGMTRCPNHEDRAPSLSWRLANDGRVLLHCFAGCEFGEIVAAVAR